MTKNHYMMLLAYLIVVLLFLFISYVSYRRGYRQGNAELMGAIVAAADSPDHEVKYYDANTGEKHTLLINRK